MTGAASRHEIADVVGQGGREKFLGSEHEDVIDRAESPCGHVQLADAPCAGASRVDTL
jgi:hypothetical protein